MLPQCPKKCLNSPMDTPEAKQWCKHNQSPKYCFDCSLFPGGTEAKKKQKKSVKISTQGRLF